MSDDSQTQVVRHALRDLVHQRLSVRWTRFATEHPHLAGAIDRTRLTEATVRRLAEDPQYQRAMRAAGHDEAMLAAASELAGVVDRWVDRVMGL